MDSYCIWCNLREDVRDTVFCADVRAYLGHLREAGLIEGFRVTRRKLGFGPPGLGEFLIMIETRDMA